MLLDIWVYVRYVLCFAMGEVSDQGVLTYSQFRDLFYRKCTRKSGYNKYRGWTQTEYQNKHYNIDQKDEGT